MKKIIKSSILFVVLLSTIFVIVSFIQSNSSEKEVLLVETYMLAESYGVSIIHNNKPIEFIEMDFRSIIEEGKETFRKINEGKGAIIQNTLQKLYNDGWKLEGTSGGDNFSRYILTK